MARRWIRGSFSLFVLGCLLLGSAPSPTLAQSEDDGGVTVPMTMDCDAMWSGTAEQQKAAAEYCGDTEGGVSPQNTVVGDCGTSTLWVFNEGSGHAGIYASANSTRGWIVQISWSIGWANVTRGNSGSFANTNYPFSSTWSTDRHPYTNTGYVQGWLNGTVNTALGVVCAIGGPWDSVTVS